MSHSNVPRREADGDDDEFTPPAAPATLPPPVPPPAAAAAQSTVAVPQQAAAAASTPAAAAPPGAPELDLAFCCDCTGSMGAYIRSAQENIRAIAQKIHDKKGNECSLRFGLVKYRDHPPQDSTFITETYPFTKSLEVMKANIDTMFAQGGGDGPEAVTAALKELVEMNWRPNASKVCVFIADAPPHGLGESGDGFPNGDPTGTDPIAMCRTLATMGVTIYAIGVEPVLSTQYKFARDFMMTMASITEGKFLPLGKADILGDVIVSTAIEGLELEQLWGKLEAEVVAKAAAANEQLTQEQLVARVEAALAEKKDSVKMQNVTVANPYMDDNYDMFNCVAMSNATSLSSARQQLKATANEHVAKASAGYAWSAQTAQCDDFCPMTESQQSRATEKAKKKAFGFK